MATKKNLSLDDYGLGDDFSDATMDFGVQSTKQGKRNPIMDLGKLTAKGALSGALEGEFIRKQVKDTFHEGYGTALDFADETAVTLKSLYNTTATTVRPMTNDLKRTVQRLMPSAGQILPDKMRRAVDTWSKDLDGQQRYNPEDAIKAQIAQAQQEIFSYEFKQRQEDRAEGKAREEIKEGMDQSRFNLSTKILNTIGMATQSLANYQEKVTVNYQRKMLELSYRQVYLLRDTHEEQKRLGAVMTEGFKSLIHNTGLPDYEKLTARNRAGGFMRNQFASMASGGLRSTRMAFMSKLRSSAEGQIKDKVGNFVNGAQNALMMGNMMLDGKEQADQMKELAESMGEHDYGVKGIAAGMGGAWLGQMGAGKGLKWLQQYLAKNPQYIKRGNQLQGFAENLPQYAHRFANSNMGEGKNPLLDLLLGFGKGTIQDALKADPTNLHRSDYSNLQGAAVYSNQANKSITEIIPGYLARLLREVSILRTGDTATPLMVYDYQKNRFDNQRNSERNALATAFSSYGMRDIKDRSDQIASTIDDPENPLTREEKKELADHLLKLHRRGGGIADKNTLGNVNNYTGKHGERLSSAFNRYLADDELGGKHVALSRQVNALSMGIEERKRVIQDLANAGHLEMLQRAGVIDPTGENIDMDRFYALHLEDDPVMAALGEKMEAVAPSKSGRRRLTGFRMPEPNRRSRQRVDLRSIRKSAPAAASMGTSAPAGAYEFEGPPHPPIQTQATQERLNWNDAEAPITKATDRLHDDLLRIEALVQAGTKISIARMKISMPGMPDMPDLDKLGEHLNNLSESGKAHLTKAKGFFDRTLRDHFSSAKDFAQKTGQQGYDFVRENAPKARDFAQDKFDNVLNRGKRGWGKFQDTKNIYLPGEKMPRLMTAKLKAGEYLDDATGKVLQSYKDIRGAVRDKITDDIVLTDAEAKEAFVRFGPVQKLITAMGAVIRPIRDAAEAALDRAHAGLLNMAALTRKGIQKAKDYLDGPQDVYIAGTNEPVMLARIMKAGGYRLKADPTKVITKITEISGPVLDAENNEVLTMAELKNGLFDKYGRPLQTGWMRGAQMAKDFVVKHLSSAKNKLMEGLKRAKDAGMHYGGRAVDAAKTGWEHFVKWVGADGLIISGGKTIVERLTEIRDLLNDRMPGRKKAFGDQDGDGIRDGSVEDIVKKRKEAKTDAMHAKEAAELEDIEKELGGGGPIANAIAALSKKMGSGDHKGLLDSILGGGIGGLVDMLPGGKLLRKGGKYLKKIPGVKGAGRLLSKIPGLGRLGRLGGGLVGAGEAAAAGEGIAAAGGAAESAAAGLAGSAAAGGLGRALAGGAGRAVGTIAEHGVLGGGARLAGRAAMALPGAAWTAGKWLLNARKMGGPLGFLLGGAGDAAGGLLLEGLGAAGAGLLSVLASPVVLGAAALAITGAGIYASYKGIKGYYDNHKSLDKSSAMRFAQYGFMPDDSTHRQAIFQLENVLYPNLKFDSKGMASLDLKKIVASNLFKLFGLDSKNHDQLEAFATWFVKRFKPVYLTHLTILHKLNGATTLAGVDKLKDEQKKDYINGAKYPDGPYDIMTSPFPDLPKLLAGSKDVAKLADEALKAIDVKKDDGKGKAAMRATDGKGLRPAQKVGGEIPGAKLDSKGKAAMMGALVYGKSAPTSMTGAVSKAVAGQVIGGATIDPAKGLDALTSVRMKTYGLTSMEPEKVSVLLQMEAAVEAKLKVQSVAQAQTSNSQKAMQATYIGDDVSIMHIVGSRFDVVGDGGEIVRNWRRWFGARFLPTYLAYRGALATQTGQTKKTTAEQQLVGNPAQAVMVGQAIVGAQADAKYGGGSVWKQSQSPWPKYTLNDDPGSTKVNLQALNQRTGKTTLPEAKAKMVNKAAASQAKDTQSDSKSSMMDSLKKRASEAWDATKNIANATWQGAKDFTNGAVNMASNVASSTWEGVKSAGTAVSSALGKAGAAASSAVGSAVSGVGQKIREIGKGLGGLAKSLPDPKGSGTWAGVKDLITAAAQMVGVDPALMGTMAAIESGFKWNAKAGTSSASGLYQFITSTWNTMIRKYGPKYGIPAGTSPTDPKANAIMGAEYVKENAAILNSKLKRPLTDTDIYAAHFLGPGGAVQLLTADPSANAVQLMPAAARANAPIFTDKGQPRTVGGVIGYLNSLVAKRGSQFGVGGGSAAGTTPKPDDKKPGADAGGVVKTAGATAPVAPSKTAPAAGTASDAMAQARAVAAATPSSKSSTGTGSPMGFGGSAPTTAGVPTVANPTAAAAPSSTPVARDTLTQNMSQIAADQLKSLKSIESILTDIHKAVAQAGGKGGKAEQGVPSNPMANAVSGVTKQAEEMTAGPISMAKRTFGTT